MILQNATVWLIGASSGIGAALAPALVAQGARLAISSRREEELNTVADAAALKGRRPLVKPLDVTDLDAMRQLYGDLVAEWGKVDVLLYNAGTWAQAEATNFNTEQAVNQVNVNFLGLIRAVGTVMPDMIARRSGEIVGMASVAGYAGFPRAAAYSSSKAGVNAFLQSLRIELHRFGVGVTTINPGFVKTDLTDRNSFPMPFMITSETAADSIIKGLLEGDTEIHFPKRLSWPLKVYTALPRPIYERLARRFMAPR
jgi:short-subunit dehydrogenase